MPITDLFILFAIILAFAVFGTALAWVEYQTRHIKVDPRVRKAENDRRQSQSITAVPLRTITPALEPVDS